MKKHETNEQGTCDKTQEARQETPRQKRDTGKQQRKKWQLTKKFIFFWQVLTVLCALTNLQLFLYNYNWKMWILWFTGTSGYIAQPEQCNRGSILPVLSFNFLIFFLALQAIVYYILQFMASSWTFYLKGFRNMNHQSSILTIFRFLWNGLS